MKKLARLQAFSFGWHMQKERPVSELIHAWERAFPEEWARCYPKHYQVGDIYASPKELAAALIEYRSPHNIRSSHDVFGRSSGLRLLAAAGLVSLGVPIFFVAPDLLTAMLQSIPPVDLDWTCLHLPFESAAFALPRGSLAHSSLGDVNYIWYARIYKGQLYPTYPGLESMGVSDDDYFMMTTACMQSPERKVLSHILLGINSHIVKLKEINCEPASDDPIVHKKAGMGAGDADMMAASATLLFNLLFVMNARAELCEYGRWTGKRTQKGLEFWTPNILGRAYVLKRPAPSGNGVSPRMHWRRGHMRQQPYGENHALRRPQWIEPALISAE